MHLWHQTTLDQTHTLNIKDKHLVRAEDKMDFPAVESLPMCDDTVAVKS